MRVMPADVVALADAYTGSSEAATALALHTFPGRNPRSEEMRSLIEMIKKEVRSDFARLWVRVNAAPIKQGPYETADDAFVYRKPLKRAQPTAKVPIHYYKDGF